MLETMEAKIAAVIGDGLQSRPGLAVVQAPAPLQAAAGAGAIRVSLAEWTPASSFEREQIAFRSATATRRILQVEFKTSLEFLRTPLSSGADDVRAGRLLLLEDMSLVSHNLAAADVRSGKAFRPAAPDPGF